MAARDANLDIEIGDTATPGASFIGSPHPTPGSRVGRYRLVYQIATGGMATVYLAIPERACRPDDALALKRVHPHLASQRPFVEMFLDEARIASRIRHPNVCRVVDYGHADGSFYLAMEYLRGRSLARVARALRTLPDTEQEIASPILAARVVADAARGLHAAHELTDDHGVPLEVVHRDVSPHNLFVGWNGVTSVVDFGIASARDRLHHTETGTVKGKFAYMSPEQMIGARVDRRADVWSLGVILWELIAGRVLFKRKTETETVVAVTRMTRPPLSSMRPGISPRLEEIVERALAREPDDRHATAAALADDLEAWLAEQPGPADAAEVSAWMHRLFPGEPEEEERLVSAALADALPTVDERSPIERSAVVRRSSGPPRLSRRAAIGAYVLAVALAMAVGALAALWSRGDAMRTSAPDATREDATSSPARKAAPAESTDVGPIRAPPNPDAPASEVLAPGHGTVSIAAVGGGADVYERGHRLGTIPGEFMLPEGRHVLVLRSHGGAELHRIGVRVRAGHASRVHVDLGR